MNKLKIKLFGELWKLSKLELTRAEYLCLQDRAIELRVPLEEIVLSTEGLNQVSVSGLMDTYKNQIEIWYKGRKVQKMKIQDFNDNYSLFPLFSYKLSKFDYKDLSKGIYIEEKEIGLVGVYEGIIEDFNLFDLEFSLVEIKDQSNTCKVLKNINYKDKKINRKLSVDTLNTRQYCFDVD